jgi:hypothetical protein
VVGEEWEESPLGGEGIYNREFRGRGGGGTVDVSVGAMEITKAEEWVEIVEHPDGNAGRPQFKRAHVHGQVPHKQKLGRDVCPCSL